MLFVRFLIQRKKIKKPSPEKPQEKNEVNPSLPGKLAYSREFVHSFEKNCYDIPNNFFDIRTLYKEEILKEEKISKRSQLASSNKFEKAKRRVKALSKGDEKVIFSAAEVKREVKPLVKVS